ncbi:hypothetical protein V5O48_016317 [Marasmius crinis-equi]|uniref:Uncharacterized protein n=1 Tax=Marasmius crinis-equi TaxID=585013 RepID=A0ABR3ES22_9AGAR
MLLSRDRVDLFRAIRKLDIRSTSDAPGRDENKWAPTVELIRRITNLREVVLDCRESVPLCLLDTLHQYHASCRLDVLNWTRLSHDIKVGDIHEEALARSPCLRSLHAAFVTGGLFNYTESAFRRILALAPNIESAAMESEFFYGVYPVTDEELEEERRESAKFEVVCTTKKSLKEIRWSFVDQQTLLGWKESIDLSVLGSLDIGILCYDALLYLRDHSIFSALGHLSFTSPSHANSAISNTTSLQEISGIVMGFVCSLPSLQSLSVTNYATTIDLPTVLLHHGTTIRSLSLHQTEGGEERWAFSVTPAQIESLGTKAPNLESLEMDINRTPDGQDESEIYSALSRIPSLARVVLHYDLGFYLVETLPNNQELAQQTYPAADSEFGKKIWRAVQPPPSDQANSSGGCRLQNLILYMGEPNRESRGPEHREWVYYERTAKQKVTVSRSERDDSRDVVSVVVEGSGSPLGSYKTFRMELLEAMNAPLPSDEDDL